MSIVKLYPADFPEKYKTKIVDVAALYHQKRWDELNDVVVCRDKYGKITSRFGYDIWDLMPFARHKRKRSFTFGDWNNSPQLQIEMKIIAYGWLFNLSPQQRPGIKFSTAYAQLSKFKMVCYFLLNNHQISIKSLSNTNVWTQFERYLQDADYSQGTIQKVFISLNAVLKLEGWHQLHLNLNPIKSVELARKLSDKSEQQILVIPNRLCDAIYSQAISLVTNALPHKELISDIEASLQANYIDGKQALDEKIKQGRRFSFMKIDESWDNRKYTQAIKDNQPKLNDQIIIPLRHKIEGIKLDNGNDFRRYHGQLITACYIICAAFSGMRESELNKLTPDSYYKDTFDGREYHMLQSHTFKLGEKRETWVTAPISKNAIELASTLTKKWRDIADYPDEKYVGSIWVNQSARGKDPSLISNWNARLKAFCEQFNFVVTEGDYQDCLTSNPHSSERIKKYIAIGQPWLATTHQFRRTLAYYFIKNRLGTLIALKQQFKHLYLTMTEWYTNGGKLASYRNLIVDSKVQQALDEINSETTTNKIFNQWHSDEALSGTHGKAIMKMRGDVPTIYSSWDVIFKAVKDGKLTLHGSMHSYCKSGYDCDMDGVVAPQFCVDCSSGSSIIDEQQAKWWQKRHRSLSAYMATGDDITVTDRSHYITQIRAAENVMRDFKMEFTPFEAELNITEVFKHE
ncbi:hypothetical protein [Vibrio crassostreae]|uniref:hypothetical protein n=1 Tax=Vibrio crassostreae TaxID=246167 RepID=UPI001B311B50|nr:hypothetical protein [Vibrio crassostreae]